MMSDTLFMSLFFAKNEHDIDEVIRSNSVFDSQDAWYPLGGNDNNFAVVENQQSNPVAAVVEKVTNSIDAILMRRCLEAGVDPVSKQAPNSVEEAIDRFFPNHKNWDLGQPRRQQAESIQILADSYAGDTANTSLMVYDDGEGQHPQDFERTFLSLLRGNKNEIHFVQGKYNMGGSGAIAFCGKRRYQLIASKRFDGTGNFGFTLVRKHPLTAEETGVKKSTWYEYFKLDGKISSFAIDELDLGLFNRKFRTGTIMKLYSYEIKGNRHIRRDLSRSLNEFLYEPALPFYVIENKERYPNDKVLEAIIFGLKRQLDDNNDYVQETFSETYTDKRIGETKVTVHVFNPRSKGKGPSDTRKTIQNEFFKNRMAILFSLNGQVHAHYTSEFVTRSLQFNLLRDYLLIHVDCTHMNLEFRQELFMASRDRLKQGEESSTLRRMLRDNLRKGQLKEIYKRRKDNISVESTDDDELLRNLAENLPINQELRSLISKTFELEREDKTRRRKKSGPDSNGSEDVEHILFNPKRYPTFFKLGSKQEDGRTIIKIPLSGERSITFDSDVENQYFDRVEDPGDMKLALMDYVPNDKSGGNKKGTVNQVADVFSVNRKSPQDGKIKVILKPSNEVQVGDEIRVKADLTAPGHEFTAIFWVMITEPKPSRKVSLNKQDEDERIGLPRHVKVYKDDPLAQGVTTWDKLQDSGIEMDWETVMYPQIEGDVLERIYINMDSNVLKSFKGNLRNISPEQNDLTDQRYISSVYFHTLFLYVINKRRDYHLSKVREDGQEEDIELSDYLRDLFSSHYAAFLLNFGTGELMEALS